MVQARARVMDTGLFEPVAAALGALVTTGSGLIVDSGCGDGWFTQGLVSTAADRPVLALDVSKDAIRATARRQTNAVLPRVAKPTRPLVGAARGDLSGRATASSP